MTIRPFTVIVSLSDWWDETVIGMGTDVPTIDLLSTDSSAGVLVDVGANMLTGVGITCIGVAPTPITLEFALPVLHAANLPSDVVMNVLIKALTDVLDDANVNVLAAVMNAFELNVPIPLAESIL